MSFGELIPLIISLLGALTAAYSVWLTRYKARAEARKLHEEAESEDVRQRGTELDNLRATNDEWSRQYGELVKRLDALRKELDLEVERRKNTEASAGQRITDLEHELEQEREARLESDRRAAAQAQHLINVQNELQTLKAKNRELLDKLRGQERTIESLNATISSLQRINEDKDSQITKMRKEISAMQIQLRAYEVRRSNCDNQCPGD